MRQLRNIATIVLDGTAEGVLLGAPWLALFMCTTGRIFHA